MEYQKIKKVSKNLQQNNSDQYDKEMPKERYVSPEEKQKIIDNFKINYSNIIMGYQKIINLLDNTPNQPTKFRKKNWAEINDEEGGTYNGNSQIKFKTSMLRSGLCDVIIVCIYTCKSNYNNY